MQTFESTCVKTPTETNAKTSSEQKPLMPMPIGYRAKRDCSLSLPSGTINVKALERITDPWVRAHLERAGEKLEPIYE